MVDSPASIPRVPAWKKLGLKLKYAKDETPTPAGTRENASASKKRFRPSDEESTPIEENKLSNEGKSEDKKSKKRKTSRDDKDIASTPTTTVDESATPSEKPPKKGKKQREADKSEVKEQKSQNFSKSKPPVQDQAVSTPIKTLRRKKSVSFTPDTKTIDGDQHLVKAWTSSLRQEEPSNSEAQRTESVASANDDASKPSKAELKKVKKEEKRKAKNDDATASSTSAAESAYTPPYLTYLSQYHTDHANWKFNKVKQSTLFENLFKIQRLPASYDNALRAYLEGLKGDAVRQRLQEQAREILDKIKDEEAQKDDAEASSDSSSSESDSDSSSSNSSSSSDSDSDSDSNSGSSSPTPTTTSAGGDNDNKKMKLTPTKSAALDRQLARSTARRREQRDEAASADRQLRLAQRRRAEIILEVLGSRPQQPDAKAVLRPKTVREAQVTKAQAEWESKRKGERKKEVKGESEESSVVSSSSSEESFGEESSSEDDSSSEDESSEEHSSGRDDSSSSSSSSDDDSD